MDIQTTNIYLSNQLLWKKTFVSESDAFGIKYLSITFWIWSHIWLNSPYILSFTCECLQFMMNFFSSFLSLLFNKRGPALLSDIIFLYLAINILLLSFVNFGINSTYLFVTLLISGNLSVLSYNCAKYAYSFLEEKIKLYFWWISNIIKLQIISQIIKWK